MGKKLNLLVIPALVIPIIVGVIPFFIGIGLSFTNWSLYSFKTGWVGGANYIAIFTDESFWSAVWVTLKYSGFCLLVEMVVGILIAFLLSVELKGQTFFRSIILIPLMVAPVLSALMWKLMLPQNGIINYMLSWFGIKGYSWLSNPATALFSVAAIDIYIFTPFVTIIVLAGIQSLPKAPYEAAAVDGASKWFVFKKVTWPLLKPLILLAFIFRFILSFKTFDTIYATTGGGPGNLTTNLHLWAYINTFKYGQTCYSVTAAAILFLFIFFISMKLIKSWVKWTGYL
jgi:multiple sugar transport system permease protein